MPTFDQDIFDPDIFSVDDFSWPGRLDEIAIYNRALSSVEVAARFAALSSVTIEDEIGSEDGSWVGGGLTSISDGPLSDGSPAIRFDETKSVTISPATLGSGGSFSVELWIRPDASQTVGLGGLLTVNNTEGVFWDSVTQTIQVLSGGGALVGPVVAAAAWHHIIVTRVTGLCAVYVNGQIAASSNSVVPTTWLLTRIGGALTGATPGNFYKGDMSHASLYDYELKDDEILERFERRLQLANARSLGQNTLGVASEKALFRMFVDNIQYELVGTATLSDDVSYHIAATYDGAAMRIYVNGVLDATLAAVHGNADFGTQTRFTIGRNAVYADQRPFSGILDEYAVYNYALSAAQVADHYAARLRTDSSSDVSALTI